MGFTKIMEPRIYQTMLIDAARPKLREIQLRLDAAGIKRKPRLVIQSGAGSGKTALSGFMAQKAISKGRTVAFLVHKDFLLSQTSLTYDRLGIPHSFLAAGRSFRNSSCYLGMVGSMKSRMGKIAQPDLAFIDEAHRSPAKSYRDIMDAWPDTTFILLTATPGFRTDKVGLDTVCDDIIQGPTNSELIEMKAISDFVYFAPSKPDLSNVHSQYGDFVQSEIDEAMKSVVVGDIVGSYKKYGNNEKAIYFATSVEMSKRYADAFNAAGIPAKHVDAETPTEERIKAAKDMANGALQVMTNCAICIEGFDLSAQAGMDVTIGVAGLCRPTQSLPLLIQMGMRALRAKPYPGVIIDHSGNYDIHNWLPSDDIQWSLAGAKRSELVGTWSCQGCGAVIRRGLFVCSHCGTDASVRIAEIKRQAEIAHVAGELEKVNREARAREEEQARLQDKIQRGRARTLEELIAFGKAKGYAPGWARQIYKARMRSKA